MKTKLFALLLIPVAAIAADECVMQSRTTTQQKIVISERGTVRSSVITTPAGMRKCIVDFRVRIGADWHQAAGEYEWDGARPSAEACGAAVKLAESDVQARVSKRNVISENVLICNDDPDRKTLRTTNPGTVAAQDQFRPHPDYPKYFYHNGTRCRWFLETGFLNKDVHNYSGIICELEDRKWVVVDKF
jgi:hypothetical protein